MPDSFLVSLTITSTQQGMTLGGNDDDDGACEWCGAWLAAI